MAANGRGHMRPNTGSRTPSFLLVGLLVVIGILGFNYWSISTKNNELSLEVDDVGMRYRSIQAKKIDLEKRNEEMGKRIEDLTKQINELNGQVEQYKNAVAEKEQKIASLEQKSDDLNMKIESAARELQLEQQDRNVCEDEVGFLRENITKLVIAHKNSLDEANRLCQLKIEEAEGKAEKHVEEVQKPDQQQLLLEQQQKEQELEKQKLEQLKLEQEKQQQEQQKLEQQQQGNQVAPPDANIKQVVPQGLPPQGNDLALAARQGYDSQKEQQGHISYDNQAQSQDQQMQSHDQQVQSHDQQVQLHEEQLQSHDQQVQSRDQINRPYDQVQSHDQQVRPYGQGNQPQDQQGRQYEQQFQSHDQEQQSHDQIGRPYEKQVESHDQQVQYAGENNNMKRQVPLQNENQNHYQGQFNDRHSLNNGVIAKDQGEIDIDQGRMIDERAQRGYQESQVRGQIGDLGQHDLEQHDLDLQKDKHDLQLIDQGRELSPVGQQGGIAGQLEEPRIQLQQQEDQAAYVARDQGDEADVGMDSRLKFAENDDDELGRDEQIIERMREQQLQGQNL